MNQALPWWRSLFFMQNGAEENVIQRLSDFTVF